MQFKQNWENGFDTVTIHIIYNNYTYNFCKYLAVEHNKKCGLKIKRTVTGA